MLPASGVQGGRAPAPRHVSFSFMDGSYLEIGGPFVDWFLDFDRRAAELLPDLTLLADEPMARHTSFRIGGPARRMAFPSSCGELLTLLSLAHSCGIEPLVIGNGTNLLAPDEGLNRLVIGLSQGLNRIERGPEPGTILAEAGASLASTAIFACKQGLSGLEFAHGIPGTVGGGVCMNAGAYGGEIKQVLEGAGILFPEGGPQFLSSESMDLSYRHSLLTERPEAVALYALFRLSPGAPEEIRARMQELMERRKASQPLDVPSAGSTFKRPEGFFAGTLIDQCGLKGLRAGGAQVSEKHAGFLVNCGGATCADMKALIAQVQERVFRETGVRLEPEVRIL